jgi:hypothetical protein
MDEAATTWKPSIYIGPFTVGEHGSYLPCRNFIATLSVKLQSLENDCNFFTEICGVEVMRKVNVRCERQIGDSISQAEYKVLGIPPGKSHCSIHI